MITIERHDDPPGTWAIRSAGYSKKLHWAAKHVPGMRFDWDIRAWVGYADAVDVVCRRLKKLGVEFVGRKAMLATERSTQHELPVAYKGLRDYQKAGVDFLVAHSTKGVLLADSLGVGKSCQAVRAVRAYRGRTVIVCLAQNLGVWVGNEFMESQVTKWWPLIGREGSMTQIEGTSLPMHEWRVWRDGKKLQSETVAKLASNGLPPDCTFRCLRCDSARPFDVTHHSELGYVPDWPPVEGCTAGLPTSKTRVVVIHYDILHYWVDWLIAHGFTRVIFDEIHEVVGERAIRTKAVKKLARACEVRIGLTGTPMANAPKNLWQTVDILSPGRFGQKFFTHGVRYCGGHQVQVKMDKVVWDFKGRSREKELHRRLGFLMLRRLKADVQKYLPPIIRETIDIKIPAKACINVDLSILKRSSVAAQALAMSADAKLPFVIEAVKKHVRDGLKVVVFTHRKLVAEHVADACRAEGQTAAVVHGDVPRSKRGAQIATIKDADGGAVLCCTLDTCSTGIDLSFASVGVYAELSYEPYVLIQSIGRLHRHGQLSTVLIQFFIGRGSIDDLIAQAVISKLDAFEAIIGDPGDELKKQLDSMPKGKEALHELYLALKGRAA